ncbi:unnamed protein product [Phytophthora lilii]|uniref:Unnamed protein product n=1 Tax=Phytophthora lilii TaxID=2077276 RepID=A0A9W6XSK4_9STRA|nr:unnamed protein product [Phytophthora lilii]
MLEAQKRYYQKNREAKLAKQKEYNEKNTENISVNSGETYTGLLPNQTRECNQVIKPFNSTFNTPFLLDTAADMAYTDHDLTNDLKIKSVDKPQDIFAEPSNEFIDKALQKISKIPDYVPLNFDVYGRAPKGNFIY